MNPLRSSHWTWAAGLWVVTMLALGTSPAVAQDRDATPSAKELWRAYPLEATPEAGAVPTASASSVAPAARAEYAPTPGDGSGGPGVLVLIAAIAAATVAGGAALARMRRRAPREKAVPTGGLLAGLGVRVPLLSASGARPTMRSDPPRRLAFAGSSERSSGQRHNGGPRAAEEPAAPTAAPPDPGLDWRAEIEWRHEPGGSRFCLVARRAGSSQRTAVSESEPLEWPPTGPDSVQALRRAVEQLQFSAVAAGWAPAQPGGAWYAKRFTWQPEPAPTISPETGGEHS